MVILWALQSLTSLCSFCLLPQRKIMHLHKEDNKDLTTVAKVAVICCRMAVVSTFIVSQGNTVSATISQYPIMHWSPEQLSALCSEHVRFGHYNFKIVSNMLKKVILLNIYTCISAVGSDLYLTWGESRGESTTFQKNLVLKDNILDRDLFLLWSITHKCGLSIPSGIFYKCKMTSV